MQVLSATFSGRWIDRGGSILWPPRGLDLTPLDFFCWDYVKNYVYVDKIPRPQSLESRNKRSRWAGNKKYTTACMARCGILTGHMQGHERCTCGNLVITRMFKTIWGRSWDSVVGIATGYGLDDRGVGVRAPVGSRIFSSPLRPDRLWSPPNLLSNGYRGSFTGVKRQGRAADHSPPTSIEVKKMWIYTSTLPYAFMA
jgi:hypothetical protein